MPARKKNRRKLRFDQRDFLWYVRDDHDSAAKVLHVLSDDKQFIVTYELGQSGSSRPPFVVVVGRESPGCPPRVAPGYVCAVRSGATTTGWTGRSSGA